jgi:putative sterol carrier protein
LPDKSGLFDKLQEYGMPKFTNVQEIIDLMPQQFSPEAAAGMDATLQLDLSGDGGGQWHMVIADQKLQLTPGPAANPSMTLKMSSADYISMINGESNPMQLFMQGKVKVGGDMSLAMKMQSLFKMS